MILGIHLITLASVTQKNCNIYAYDAIVSSQVISDLGMTPIQAIEDIDQLDVAFIMNNHCNNIMDGLLEKLSCSKTKSLLFDGWSLYERLQVENIPTSFMALWVTPQHLNVKFNSFDCLRLAFHVRRAI